MTFAKHKSSEESKEEADSLMVKIKSFNLPARQLAALDFGCGIGHLTRALAPHFDKCLGLDISAEMIEKARELNQEMDNCKFVVSCETLETLPDNHFDLVYANVVLQHAPKRKMIKRYLADFGRIIKKEGVIVFQLPSHIPFKDRLWSGFRSYNFIPEKEMVEYLQSLNLKVLSVENDNGFSSPGVVSRIYYVGRTI